jgi:hypothetical protein
MKKDDLALCASSIAAFVSVIGDPIDLCSKNLFCAPPPHEIPHTEILQPDTTTILARPSSSAGPTGLVYASANLAGAGSSLTANAMVVHAN